MYVSVVVPFQNVARYIEHCLEALLSQTYPRESSEIIMVDNNSTDGSAEIVGRYPQVRLLRQPKPGAYAARNRGVAESGGEIVAFTDSDCAPEADWLEEIAGAMRFPWVSLVQGRQRFAFESIGLSVLSDYEAQKAAYTFSSKREEIYYGYTNNMAVRRSAFDCAGPFLELERGADVVFVRKVAERYGCEAVRYVPQMCVRHLEVTSVWKWFRKMKIYGRSFRGYGKLVRSRPLNAGERLKSLQATIRSERYSVTETLLLILLLSIGVLYYEAGRRSRAGTVDG